MHVVAKYVSFDVIENSSIGITDNDVFRYLYNFVVLIDKNFPKRIITLLIIH